MPNNLEDILVYHALRWVAYFPKPQSQLTEEARQMTNILKATAMITGATTAALFFGCSDVMEKVEVHEN